MKYQTLNEITLAYEKGEMSREQFIRARKAELHFIETGEYSDE